MLSQNNGFALHVTCFVLLCAAVPHGVDVGTVSECGLGQRPRKETRVCAANVWQLLCGN
jgi:hypothetical protein